MSRFHNKFFFLNELYCKFVIRVFAYCVGSFYNSCFRILFQLQVIRLALIILKVNTCLVGRCTVVSDCVLINILSVHFLNNPIVVLRFTLYFALSIVLWRLYNYRCVLLPQELRQLTGDLVARRFCRQSNYKARLADMRGNLISLVCARSTSLCARSTSCYSRHYSRIGEGAHRISPGSSVGLELWMWQTSAYFAEIVIASTSRTGLVQYGKAITPTRLKLCARPISWGCWHFSAIQQ